MVEDNVVLADMVIEIRRNISVIARKKNEENQTGIKVNAYY